MMSSSVIEMSGIEDDYETDFTDTQHHQKETQQSKLATDIQQEMQKNVTSMILESGKQQAKRAFNLYANIDILRPYFDVDPKEVRDRLFQSLMPPISRTTQPKLHHELYGPVMLVFTLIALLLYQMKTADHAVQEGTLMGSAFAVCFGYWIGTSAFLWFVSYVCNTHATMMQLLSLIGYGLFSQCLVIFLTTIFHPSHDHMYFYLLWAVIGGLAAFKMVVVLTSRTIGQKQKVIVGCTLAAFHLLFLLYLHFAYHQIVEDLSQLLDQEPQVAAIGKDLNVVERDINGFGSKQFHVKITVAPGVDPHKAKIELPNLENIENVNSNEVKEINEQDALPNGEMKNIEADKIDSPEVLLPKRKFVGVNERLKELEKHKGERHDPEWNDMLADEKVPVQAKLRGGI